MCCATSKRRFKEHDFRGIPGPPAEFPRHLTPESIVTHREQQGAEVFKICQYINYIIYLRYPYPKLTANLF